MTDSTGEVAGNNDGEPLKPAAVGDSPLGASQPSQEITRRWAETSAAEVEQYNAWAVQREPYSQRVRRWRDSIA